MHSKTRKTDVNAKKSQRDKLKNTQMMAKNTKQQSMTKLDL